MLSTDILYKLAVSPQDYKTAHDFLRNRAGFRQRRLSFPTVLAVRDAQVLGLLGTRFHNKFVWADPLAVDPEIPMPGFLIVRLVEAYENVLRAAGVSSYIFFAYADREDWASMIERGLGVEPFENDHGLLWYERRVH